MRKKKSYMNKQNILSEGFFNVLASVFAPNSTAAKKAKYKKLKKTLGKDKAKLAKLEKDYTKMTRQFDKEFEKLTGVKAERGDTIEDLLNYAEDEAKRRGYI